MKSLFIITALFTAAFTSCRKAEDSPKPQPPLIQSLSYDHRTDSVQFRLWYEPNLTTLKECLFEGDSFVISFDFTSIPDHAKRYRIVSTPAADDEVSITGEAGYKSYGFYSENTPAQYLDVSLEGTNIRISGTDIQLFEFNHVFGNIGHTTASFNLVDKK